MLLIVIGDGNLRRHVRLELELDHGTKSWLVLIGIDIKIVIVWRAWSYFSRITAGRNIDLGQFHDALSLFFVPSGFDIDKSARNDQRFSKQLAIKEPIAFIM